ncbi:MAG: hypothetical protein ACRCX8_08185 [Sarcina sp.]
MIIYLVIISAILIILNIKAINKKDDKNSFEKILNSNKEGISDFTVEMIKLRKELSETVVELQQDIVLLNKDVGDIKRKIYSNEILKENSLISERLEQNVINDINIKKDKTYDDLPEAVEIFNDNTNSSLKKVEEVKKLLSQGISDESICTKLEIGRGELLLIKGLYN